MRELYFVSPYRRSIRTIHFQYGDTGKKDTDGKKFILKITSCEINGKRTSEGNTKHIGWGTYLSRCSRFRTGKD